MHTNPQTVKYKSFRAPMSKYETKVGEMRYVTCDVTYHVSVWVFPLPSFRCNANITNNYMSAHTLRLLLKFMNWIFNI